MPRPKREGNQPPSSPPKQGAKLFRLCSVACMVGWVVATLDRLPDTTILHIGPDWTRRSTVCAFCGQSRHRCAGRRRVWI